MEVSRRVDGCICCRGIGRAGGMIFSIMPFNRQLKLRNEYRNNAKICVNFNMDLLIMYLLISLLKPL